MQLLKFCKIHAARQAMVFDNNMDSINRKLDILSADKIVVHEDNRYSRLKESTIMMVDDEPIMLEVIQALLEDEGYQNFIPVERSSLAIDTVIRFSPDVLLLDLDMPEVNGFEVLMAVRAHDDYHHLPVIILTASGNPESKLKALELGATDFLSKPVDPSELALRVRNTLSAKAYQDQLAYYDSLTGLPNRKLFIDRLSWGIELVKRERRQLAMLDIGLDRFRQINETLGMYAGDRILKVVAERLSEIVRSSDVVSRKDETRHMENMARTGGDEFSIVLCSPNSVENASTISSRILEAIKRSLVIDDNEIFLSASIGIAVYPDDGEDVESLIKHASSAKDFAKKQGTDNYQFYSSEMNQRSRERMKLEMDLRKVLERKELELYYQPKIDTLSGDITGMESLLRWNSPERGLISPLEFIPVAEETGVIVPIGDWVLHEACTRTKQWNDSGRCDLTVSVNVSAKQFNDVGFKASVISALQASGLESRNLILEITESILMSDAEHNVGLLKEIRQLGVSFSVDDFGTGYSSLSYLKKFPINELKIDRSFLTGVPDDMEDNSIVKAIIAMAHSLGQKVVAEGVETIEQIEFLRQYKCDIIQGFYFSKPLNKTDFITYQTSKG